MGLYIDSGAKTSLIRNTMAPPGIFVHLGMGNFFSRIILEN